MSAMRPTIKQRSDGMPRAQVEWREAERRRAHASAFFLRASSCMLPRVARYVRQRSSTSSGE